METWLIYSVLGLVSGVFSALFGVGSGIIMVPALVIMFSFPQKSAQGISLAIMVPMACAGAYRYIRNPGIEVDLKAALFIAVFAVAGAFIGSGIAARIPGHVLRKAFAVVLIVAALKMLLTRPPERGTEKENAPPSDAVQVEASNNNVDSSSLL